MRPTRSMLARVAFLLSAAAMVSCAPPPPPALTADDEYDIAHSVVRLRYEASLEALRKAAGLRGGPSTSLVRTPTKEPPNLPGLAEAKLGLKEAMRERWLAELKALPPLPKVVHVTWPRRLDIASLRGQPILREGVQRILELNPGWRVEVSDDADIESYLRTKLAPADYALVRSVQIVEKADLWRLLKMYYEGGVYTDLDRLHNQRFDEILDVNRTRMLLPQFVSYGNEPWLAKAGGVEAIAQSPDVRTTLRRQPIIDFTQDFMCSSPGNPAVKAVIDLALARRWVCKATAGQASFARDFVFSGASEPSGEKRPCTTMEFGPTAFFNGVTKHMLGRAIRRHPGTRQIEEITEALRFLRARATSCPSPCPLLASRGLTSGPRLTSRDCPIAPHLACSLRAVHRTLRAELSGGASL